MNIQMLDPASLKEYPDNPKAHTSEQVDAIARSIKEFGFDQPIVVDKHLTIIKGHGRRAAAVQLKMKTVPVIVSDADAPKARLNRVLDNHLTSGQYDQFALREELLQLDSLGKLETSLFSKETIPELTKAMSGAEASLFSLLTIYKCPSCGYRW